MEHFHQYLFGAKFTIYTDHFPLLSIIKTPKNRRTYEQQVAQLQNYTFDIKHRQGKLNPADPLSRHPIPAYYGENAFSPTSYDELLAKAPITLGHLPAEKDPITGKPPPYTSRLGKLYKETSQRPLRVLHSKEVPLVLTDCHDNFDGGHFKIGATTKKLRERFW